MPVGNGADTIDRAGVCGNIFVPACETKRTCPDDLAVFYYHCGYAAMNVVVLCIITYPPMRTSFNQSYGLIPFAFLSIRSACFMAEQNWT
jgi:hypothetical protein